MDDDPTLFTVGDVDELRHPYVDAAVAAGVRYRYRVRAISALARSPWSDSNAAIAREPAPKN